MLFLFCERNNLRTENKMTLTLTHTKTNKVLFTGNMEEMNKYAHEEGLIIYDYDYDEVNFYAYYYNEEKPEIDKEGVYSNPNRLYIMSWKENNQFIVSNCSPWTLNCMITDNYCGAGFPIGEIAELKTGESIEHYIGEDNIKIEATNKIAN